MQFYPCQTSILAPNSSVFFTLVLSLGLKQIDLQLIIKLSILFNFTLDFNQLGPRSSTPFTERSLAAIFFNLTPIIDPKLLIFLQFYH
jgi:hypothetical protein